MIDAPPADVAPIRLVAAPGRVPLGAIFATATASSVAAVGLLRLDRLPWSTCYFKALTGCPCPTCGTTRALGRLFALDVAGALAMNPLATVGVFVIGVWGLVDVVLTPWGRSLSVELSTGVGRVARAVGVLLLVANWFYLLTAGR
jgi:hypothetical protein